MKKQNPPNSTTLPWQHPLLTPLLRWLFVSLFAVTAPVLHAGVTSAPTLTNPTFDAVTATTATLGGEILVVNSGTISERGVVYSITASNPNPTPANGTIVVAAGTTADPFTVGVTELAPGTSYSFRAYAINEIGTGITDPVSTFTTLAVTPEISTPTSASVSTDTGTAVSYAELGGNVTVAGSEVTERGVVYSLTTENTDPLIGGTGVSSVVSVITSNATGAFAVPVPNLLPGVSYTFKAYITNSDDTTVYTDTDTFTTPAVAPLISDPTTALVTSSSATLGGNITNRGGSNITKRGVVYSAFATNPNPTIGGTGVTNRVVFGTSIGVFSTTTSTTVSLQPNTLYVFRAYATNSVGTNYTELGNFTTEPEAPTISSRTSASITSSSAVLGGNVLDTGGIAITRGVVVSVTATNSNPLIGGLGVGTFAAAAPHATGKYTVSVTGLLPNTTYSFKAYARNAAGDSYTSAGTFKTLAGAPSIGALTTLSVSSTGATLAANVTATNGSNITARGIVYSLNARNSNPVAGGTGVTRAVASTNGTGAFTVAVTGLEGGKVYAYKAFATNGAGTTYTAAGTFETDPGAPSVATNPTKSNISATAAKIGSNVTKDNGATITERGILYSISSEVATPAFNPNGSLPANVSQKIVAGTTGLFATAVKPLQPATTYSVRAYAINSVGTTYSAVGTFTTKNATPAISERSLANVDTDLDAATSSATLGGEITATNGAAITERGVVYSLTARNKKPKLRGKGVTKAVASGTGVSAFTVDVTGLKPGKRYSFSAYATNSVGTRYTAAGTFTTDPARPTLAAATTKRSITASTAILGGRITKPNGAPITERGVVFSTSNENPQIGGNNVTKRAQANVGIGRFSLKVTGLEAETTYFYRAYATNSQGTKYSDTGTVTTKASSLARAVVSGDGSLAQGSPLQAGLSSVVDTTETYYTINPADGSKYLTLVINKAPGTESQARTVEVSGNLTDWFSGSSHTTVLSDDATTLKVRDNTPVTADTKRYIRLK